MILVYTTKEGGIAQALTRRMDSRSNRSMITCYSRLEDLEQRLRQPRLDLKIMVLAAASEDELDRLVSLKELFADLRLILILPDDCPQTLIKAHRLSPRFVTHADAGTAALVAVLEKMVGCFIQPTVPHAESI